MLKQKNPSLESGTRTARLLPSGYIASAGLFLTTIVLIYLSGPCGYDYGTPAAVVVGDLNFDLMNQSDRADQATFDYLLQADAVIYNNGGPYFGSILGLPGPTTDHKFDGCGVYFRWLGWDADDYWFTLLISLWWLVVASLAFPFAQALGWTKPHFSLRSLTVAITTVCVLCALPNPLALLHPVFISAAMTLAMLIRLGYSIAPRAAYRCGQ